METRPDIGATALVVNQIQSLFRPSRLALAFLALILVPQIGRAQQDVTHDTLVEARALRDAGRLEPAASLLRPFVSAHPDQAEAARLLGETLYWLNDRDAARATFEAAVARHQASVELRLTYGQMLVETGDVDRARQLLDPLIGTRGSRGRAEMQLGKAAYWAGDQSTARRLFAAALAADPANGEARTMLRDILLAVAPRVDIAATTLHDDQPLDRTSVKLGAKVFATPLVSIAARAEPTRIRLEDGATTTLTLLEGAVWANIPRLRTEIDLVGGTVARETSSEWTGRLGIGIRSKGGLIFRARGERSPYLNTVASVTTPIMMEAIGATLDWTHRRGWLAQAAASLDRFPDQNRVTTGYLWILAPIVNERGADVHLGYAFAAQRSDESRYTIVAGGGSTPGPGIPSATTGAYVPYYTPLDLRSHSAVASLVLRAGSRITVKGGASYGVAQETGESVQRRASGPLQPPTYAIVRAPRTFSPWNARVSVDAALNDLLTLSVSGETMRTAFYQAAMLRVGLTQTFPTPSLRRLRGQ